ncbi:flagellar filament capping protein FliD [Paenibacillus qinlingensis]|uniref:flagellar filament capping protein FliD n=1 Tax=Paenibacillus qinlingensis TaxID=1837343 RepID=UPI001564DF5A|nr:flagellar filament capping protein FliD [Paenibacillus qinlingensis]NQX61913.1 flagellar filament capping protein FliD [Paenibacillus qinlingensis]
MVLRLSGFSNSGIDIDETVKKLMAAAKIPQDKLKQQKQILEWQRDDYRAINTKILNFRSAATDMTRQGIFQSKKSSSADESILSVTSTATAPEGIYSLKVNKLATSASVTSEATGKSSDSALLKDIDPTFTANTTLSIGGEKGTATITVKPTDSIALLVASVNGKSSTTGVTMSYDATIDKFFFASSSTGSKAAIDLKMGSDENGHNLLTSVLKLNGDADNNPVTPNTPLSTDVVDKGQTLTGTVNFADGITTLIDKDLTTVQKFHMEVNGKSLDYEISKTTTVGQLIDQINSSDIGKSGVSAYLDENNKLAFNNPDQTKPITFGDATADSYNLLDKLGVTAPISSPAPGKDYASFRITGQKAQIEFNGASAEYDTNTFAISGMNITIKKASPTTVVNITNTRDVDTVFNSIKSFVDKYNELIDTVNTKTSEKKYKDFTPLTDEQRESMKEDQITIWETKAKSGMLRRDPLLTSGLTNFRIAFSSTVEGLPVGNAKTLSQIGISTAIVSGKSISGSYLENGKIYIDEDKLKKAIAEKPDEVMALFNANDGLKDSNKGDGLARRLSDQADAVFKNITAKAGITNSADSSYLMGETLEDMNERIDNFTDKLKALETRYYKQFTAMEKYMNQMTAQSAQLTQQMG